MEYLAGHSLSKVYNYGSCWEKYSSSLSTLSGLEFTNIVLLINEVSISYREWRGGSDERSICY